MTHPASNLIVQGIVIHKISPFEQRAFAGAVTKGFPNTMRRMRLSIIRAWLPLMSGVILIDYVENLYTKLNRKDQSLFDNDV